MGSFTMEEMNAVYNSYSDLGKIDWERAMTPSVGDNHFEYNRVAKAFMEPELEDEMDHFIEVQTDNWSVDGWPVMLMNNIEFFPKDKVKAFLEFVIDYGY